MFISSFIAYWILFSSNPTVSEVKLEIGMKLPFTSLDCHFTEPFINTSFIELKGHENIAGILNIDNMGDVDTAFVKSVQDSTTSEGDKKVLISDEQKELLTVVKDGKGSDGMSDTVYAYSATYNWNSGKIYGGCEVVQKTTVVDQPLIDLANELKKMKK